MPNETYEAFDGKVFDSYGEYYNYTNVTALAPYEGKICFLNDSMKEMPLLLYFYWELAAPCWHSPPLPSELVLD